MNQFEQAYFEAEKFWENGALLDPFNSSRIKTTKSMIPGDTKNLVDVGCGNGVFLNSLLDDQRPIDLLGVDRSRAALKYVRTSKLEGDITKLNLDDSSFDCVVSLEVIEHLPVPDFKQALHELARVSRKYVIISVPFDEKIDKNQAKCPSCLSRINRDLHLRSFDEQYFVRLMDGFGFKNKLVRKEGPVRTYVGHTKFRRLLREKEFYQWNMPICPVCGFEGKGSGSQNEAAHETAFKDVVRQKSPAAKLLGFPKRLWPKETTYYWIIGLFEKRIH